MEKIFLYHATTKERAEKILESGCFEPRDQLYDLSLEQFNYFYASYRFDGGIHYQALMTAMASNVAEICVIQIPIEEVLGEKPYLKDTFLVGDEIKVSLTDDVEWTDLLREEDIAEVLLRPFSFDVRKATMWSLDWHSPSTRKQLLEVLLNKTYADGIGYLPYSFEMDFTEQVKPHEKVWHNASNISCYADVLFDKVIRVQGLFEALRPMLGEKVWKAYMLEIKTTLKREVLDEEAACWSMLFDEYETAYTKTQTYGDSFQ